MKLKLVKILLPLLLLASPVVAACNKFKDGFNSASELAPMPSIIRDAADGRWQAGGSNDVWDLSCDVYGSRMKVFDTGLYGTWDLDHGAANYGVHAGFPVGFITATVNHFSGGWIPDPMAYLSKVSSKWKPLAYCNALLSFDGDAGYRPVLGKELNHQFVYGYMFRLNIKWTIKQTIDAVNAGL